MLPSVGLLLLISLTVLNPVRLTRATRLARRGSLLLVATITIDNAFSAGFLDYDLVTSKAGSNAVLLLASAAAIYLTNIIAFGLWYWEYDRGGPMARAAAIHPYPDFLFPQMATPQIAPPRLGAHLPRLPLCQLHQRHRVLSDRHHAGVPLG